MICAGHSDILYPGGTLGENLCIVYAPVVAVRTRSHVALDTYDIHIYDIYQHIRLMPLSRLQHTID